jgi:DNA-binding PadR family transcriptional regulator
MTSADASFRSARGDRNSVGTPRIRSLPPGYYVLRYIAMRTSDPSILIMTSLADAPKHGYAITRDVEEIAGVKLGPGTLYGAIARLEERGLIEPLHADDRRRPYRLTGAGAAALRAHLTAQKRVASVGLHRLSTAGLGA